MTEKSIIIIGAGLAGLSTGCYAQMNGYRTHIFEHHTGPGGVCTAWKRKGYAIDGCIHFLMGHRPGQPLYKFYSELTNGDTSRFFALTTYGQFIDEASGRSVKITWDMDKLERDLKALAPADAKAIGELMKAVRGMQGFNMSMDKPRQLMSPFDKLKETWQMRRQLKYFSGKWKLSAADYVRDFQDPFLRWAIENLFLPEVPMFFILMLLGQLADGLLGHIEGGSRGFVLPIEKRYQELGGKVTYKSTVAEILVENNRAIGVRLADGSKHHTDIVVSAADGYSTIFEMLGGRFIDEKIKNRFQNWPMFRPLLMVSFGVARDFANETSLSVIHLADPLIIGNQSIEGFFFRLFNYDTTLNPPGKTVVQAEIETDFDYWSELQMARPRYDAEKQRVATEVLKRLETFYPGISHQVEMTDVATSYTTWRYTRNHKGAYEGWLPTPKTFNTTVEKTLPGLENFYMAGQWVEPGGGTLPALYSGRNVVQLLCHRDGKPFSSQGIT